MITVLDDHNLIVTTGSARIDGDPHVIALTPADAAALFDFYFARGRHHVIVDFGEVQLKGCVETRWDGSTTALAHSNGCAGPHIGNSW